jgi:hypothetical protein
MLADDARIRVLNGTSSPQLEARTGDYLTARKLSVTETGNTKSQSRTTIVLYAPKLYAMRYLMDIFDITQSSQILIKPDPAETVDIEIRLGPDWAGKLPVE